MVKKKPIAASNLPKLLATLNQVYKDAKQPLIQFETLARDTAVVTVDDPDLLTQRMGSTGAICYLAGATFTLKSLKGVDSVWFDFPAGDHASSGRYDRASYIGMISVTKR